MQRKKTLYLVIAFILVMVASAYAATGDLTDIDTSESIPFALWTFDETLFPIVTFGSDGYDIEVDGNNYNFGEILKVMETEGASTLQEAADIIDGEVTVLVTGVSLDKTTMTLTEGGATGNLTATVSPTDATNKNVTWSTSDESIATVADGVVTPVSVGTATITVITEDGSFTATCNVTVETDKNKFEYMFINNNSEIEITGYVGTDFDIVIPSEIEGKPVVSIGNNSFQAMNLTSVIIPDSVTRIGALAFDRNQLFNVTISNNVINIESGAFSYNHITEIVLPENLLNIGSEAFNQNPISSIIIPDSVTIIGSRAFYENELTNLVIGENVEIIEYGAFAYNNLNTVILPNSVVTIGSDAFRDNKISRLEIGCNVTDIGSFAFAINNLGSLDLGKSVRTIGTGAFGVNSIRSVNIPYGLATIGDNAFDVNYIESIEIPPTVISIGKDSFATYTIIYGEEGSFAENYAIAYGNTFVPINIIDVESISIHTESNQTIIGIDALTLQMIAEINPNEATYSDIIWSVEPITGEAKINCNGLLELKKSGIVTVKAKSIYDQTLVDSLDITITNQIIKAESVSLDKTTMSLKEGGETGYITSTVLPTEATNKKVTWTSSDETVATVSYGVVTPLSGGTATITVTTEDGSFTAVCEVTVEAKVVVTGVTLDQSEIVLTQGGATGNLTATVSPTDAENKNVKWRSSNDSVATVLDGVVTPLSAGLATIYVTTEDGGYMASARAEVRIGINYIEELTLIGKSQEFPLDGNYVLMRNLDFNLPESYINSNGIDYGDLNGDGIIKSAITELTEGDGFLPIGNRENAFTGSFDGNNYTVSNIYINRPNTIRVGLFGYTIDSKIVKVGLSGNVTGNYVVGGLVGSNQGSIRDSFSNVKVTSGEDDGGQSYAGGLVGLQYRDAIYGADILNCYASGDVMGTGNNVGGLVGDSDGNISNSYALGNVTGNKRVGGLVGGLSYKDISNSYASGDVNGSYAVGGLVGQLYYGEVSKSYFIGNAKGALVGFNNLGYIRNSTALIGSGFRLVYGSIAGTTEPILTSFVSESEMKNVFTYSNIGWSISESTNLNNTDWGIDESLSFPYLINNEQDPHPGITN